MPIPSRSIGMILVGAVLLASVVRAGQPPATVAFAPAVADRMAVYGEGERATLESAIDTALARATRAAPLPAGLTIQVTIEELAPSHPTREQLMANPAVDPIRSHSLGGAQLAGAVRDASGHVLTTVTHRYFAPTLGLGSASKDPWADARLAIDQFALKLAAACRDLKRS